MSYENIQVAVQDGVGTVTIDRPKVMNALNHQTLVELASAFDAAKQDDGVRALVLTGSGDKAFVAGASASDQPRNSPSAIRVIGCRLPSR